MLKPSKFRRIEARRKARESQVLAIERAARRRVREAAELSAPVVADGAPEGTRFQVVLITEGLGNKRDMNYYSAEAIVNAPAVFEGKPCFLNHPSMDDERNIPERRVEDKCGYFKNLRAVDITDGPNKKKALVGELHFDLSETGRLAADKARTALHYRQEFPASADEYVGLSINADGQTEERRMTVEGEQEVVNYVTAFTDAASCDLVTTPARGGRFLSLMESTGGAREFAEAVVLVCAMEGVPHPGVRRAAREGGPGSGDFGHAGRPGQIGGSAKAGMPENPEGDEGKELMKAHDQHPVGSTRTWTKDGYKAKGTVVGHDHSFNAKGKWVVHSQMKLKVGSNYRVVDVPVSKLKKEADAEEAVGLAQMGALLRADKTISRAGKAR